MYDDSDIDAAVAAGQLTPLSAVALRRFVAARRADPPAPGADRYFRYTWAVADILPALAVALVTCGAIAIAWQLMHRFAAVPVASVAWFLSSRFVPRRQALPMTLLCLICAASTAAAATAFVTGDGGSVKPAAGIFIAGSSAAACWTYWRLYRLPLAVPLALIATLAIGDHLMAIAVPHPDALLATAWTLLVGLIMFAAAMCWDTTDVYRQTARSDVAFWMHLLAAFLLCGAVVRAVAGVPAAPGWGGLFSLPQPDLDLVRLVIFAIFTVAAGLLSLIIDRRALMTFAIIFLLGVGRSFGGPALFPVLVLGSGAALLGMNFHWRRLRCAVLRRLPLVLRAQLPRLGELPTSRPIE